MRRGALLGPPATLALAAALAQGCSENATPAASVRSAEAVAGAIEGRQLYMAHCMSCHQPQGEGVPSMQPPLAGSAMVTGPPEPLIRATLLGYGPGGRMLEPSGRWSVAMQGFEHLSDERVAAILTYIRSAWGNDAGPVDADLVADVRDGL